MNCSSDQPWNSLLMNMFDGLNVNFVVIFHILGAGSLKEYKTISVQDDANNVKANNAEYADIAKITLIHNDNQDQAINLKA